MIERHDASWPRVAAWTATVAVLLLLYGIIIARLLP